ncbi:TonB-dependent siderophore receptor [Marinimicrobium agarilyticum]|uniref:TonB-dependent siderophore receptor n=1 Tax=Marinimicrobium agarilyticum TaxID=306546 RepID=UPI00040E2205|nr:TonB-dependent siderophore receptor [Marinimicrobium agarilyticum]
MYAQDNSRARFTRKGLVLAITSLAISPLGHAQNTTDAQKAVSEIVVTSRYTTNEQLNTATGLGLTLYETPQSVTVMTAQRITDQNLDSLTDVVNSAAGVSARAQDSTRHTFSARGFAINNYQIDGIPIYWEPGGNAGETQSNMSLYERVEIVRGATGLLTGAGNPSASINLVRKHADSPVLTGSVDLSAGRWNTYGATADVSTPLNDTGSVRGRFVGHVEQGESFRDLAEESTTVFYGTIDADLTDSTLLRVGASRQENEPEGSTWGGLPVWHADGSRTDWDRSKTIAADWTSWSSTVEHYYLDLIQEFGDWEAKFSVNNNVNASDQMLLYLSGTPDKETGLGMSASPRNAATEREQTSVSLQLSGQYGLLGRDHELTFGVVDHQDDSLATSYVRDDDTVAPVGNFNEWDGSYPQPTWLENKVDIDQTTDQFGVYAATRLSISDPFKVILGGRLADWEQSGPYYGSPRDYGDDNVFIPYVGALYEFNGQHTLYASYTDIFQPQNAQDSEGDFLDPIRGKSKEVGLKSLFFNGALQTNVAVFSILQDNLAQPLIGVPIPGKENSQASIAAEGAESQGFELEIVGELNPNWDLSLSYTNFDVEDANGNPVNTENPNELFKLFTTYYFEGQLEGLTVAGGVNWEGRSYTDAENLVTEETERLEQDAYALANLMVRYEITDQLSAQLNVKNLLDETYYSQIGFYRQLEYGEPRNFTASLNYEF